MQEIECIMSRERITLTEFLTREHFLKLRAQESQRNLKTQLYFSGWAYLLQKPENATFWTHWFQLLMC